MMKVFSILLALNVTVFAKRLVESDLRVAHGHRAGVEVVNGREVEVIGEDLTEDTSFQELDEHGQVRGDAWMKKLVVKRMKGNLSAATLPDAWSGRFELGKVLGKGGFGEVFKVNVLCDGKNSSVVSAKYIRRDSNVPFVSFAKQMDTQKKELQRMQAHWSEYVASTVGSPDSADSKEFMFPGNPVLGKVRAGQWVMMPLYNGGSFKDLLSSCSLNDKCKETISAGDKKASWHQLEGNGFRKIDQLTVLALFDNALAGLEAIHKQGLAHMDLKPDNIMIHCKEEGKLRNIHDCFGIVIDLGTLCNKTICSTTTITGTRGYFSPEVLSFEPEKMYIPSNDVWSMGVILFSLLYLEMPSYMDYYTRQKLFDYKVREDPRMPTVLSDMDELVADMLESDYQKRVTLPKARERLRNYLDGQAFQMYMGKDNEWQALTTMLSESPSKRGLAGDLPSCVNEP